MHRGRVIGPSRAIIRAALRRAWRRGPGSAPGIVAAFWITSQANGLRGQIGHALLHSVQKGRLMDGILSDAEKPAGSGEETPTVKCPLVRTDRRPIDANRRFLARQSSTWQKHGPPARRPRPTALLPMGCHILCHGQSDCVHRTPLGQRAVRVSASPPRWRTAPG
jgi:hypothetical protein